jgi:hypothetical protein
MLNLGFFYGGAFGSASGWLYGTLHGPYVSESVALIDSMVHTVTRVNPASFLADHAILAAFGLVIGACAGSLYSGRTMD